MIHHKHIMLMFLSDVKTEFDKDTNRRRISAAEYKQLGEQDPMTMTTNESAIRCLLKNGYDGQPIEQIDRLFLFASQKVRTSADIFNNVSGIKLVTDDETGQQRLPSHLEYFEHRLHELDDTVYPETRPFANCIDEQSIYPFDESADVTVTMEMAADLAHRIHEYVVAQRQEDSEVILHVDMTGGFRHANMILLTIMRLLQYDRVSIGHVYYSNFTRGSNGQKNHGKVEEVGDIYRLLNLISGAEEFVHFGSIKAVSDYFAHKKASSADPEHELSQPLEDLLKSMRTFSDEILLCHRATFIPAIHQLYEALQTFQAHSAVWHDANGTSQPARLNDKLMLQMENRILDDYAPLFSIEQDPLAAVRWCVEHDHLQQAVTLFIEMLPKYLFADTPLLRLSDELHDLTEEVKNRDKNKNTYGIYELYFFFMNHFLTMTNEHKDAEIKRYLSPDKKIAQGHMKNLCNQVRLYKSLKNPNTTDAEREQRLHEFRDLFHSKYPNYDLPRLRADFYHPGEPAEQFLVRIADCIFCDKSYAIVKLASDTSQRIKSRLSAEELQRVICGYYKIKAERNTEDHAKETLGPFASATELKECLNALLDDIAGLTQKYQ